MGGDIAGISVVAMINAPPNPENCLQRSGRSGETKSVALTLCKNDPHGEHIFCYTRWAFETSFLNLPMELHARYSLRAIITTYSTQFRCEFYMK
ncbi:hypothetical protein ACP3VW_14240 [Vibrio sp. DNB22_17_1]